MVQGLLQVLKHVVWLCREANKASAKNMMINSCLKVTGKPLLISKLYLMPKRLLRWDITVCRCMAFTFIGNLWFKKKKRKYWQHGSAIGWTNCNPPVYRLYMMWYMGKGAAVGHQQVPSEVKLWPTIKQTSTQQWDNSHREPSQAEFS